VVSHIGLITLDWPKNLSFHLGSFKENRSRVVGRKEDEVVVTCCKILSGTVEYVRD